MCWYYSMTWETIWKNATNFTCHNCILMLKKSKGVKRLYVKIKQRIIYVAFNICLICTLLIVIFLHREMIRRIVKQGHTSWWKCNIVVIKKIPTKTVLKRCYCCCWWWGGGGADDDYDDDDRWKEYEMPYLVSDVSKQTKNKNEIPFLCICYVQYHFGTFILQTIYEFQNLCNFWLTQEIEDFWNPGKEYEMLW